MPSRGLWTEGPAPGLLVTGLRCALASEPCWLRSWGAGRASTWLAPGLSGLSRAQARLGGPSAGPAMETKAGAVLGFALSSGEGDRRAGQRL